MTRLEPPAHAGYREQAQDLVATLPADLTGNSVVLDCSGLRTSSPSFIDELVKQVLVIRNADFLDVVAAPERARTLLQLAADNRGVTGQLRVAIRAA